MTLHESAGWFLQQQLQILLGSVCGCDLGLCIVRKSARCYAVKTLTQLVGQPRHFPDIGVYLFMQTEWHMTQYQLFPQQHTTANCVGSVIIEVDTPDKVCSCCCLVCGKLG